MKRARGQASEFKGALRGCAEGSNLVPVVEVDGAGVATRGRSLCGGEEAVGDGGKSARTGGAGAVADFLRARAEVPGGHAGVRGGRGQHKLFRRRRRHVQRRRLRVLEKFSDSVSRGKEEG